MCQAIRIHGPFDGGFWARIAVAIGRIASTCGSGCPWKKTGAGMEQHGLKKKFGQEMPSRLNSTAIIDPIHDTDCNK
jgi:hypothetical protein